MKGTPQYLWPPRIDYSRSAGFNNENTVVFLIGTFLDMKSKCKNINQNELEEFIALNQYKYYEISSKTGEGIREFFDASLRLLVDKNLGKDVADCVSKLQAN